MKILAPVSAVEEVEMLLHFGADELYCGLSTPEWENHFGGQWWMNRRSPAKANLISWEDMQRLVQLVHERNASVSLTLNAPFYPQGSIRYLLRLVEKVVSELRIDGLIVSDVNFLLLLSREKFPVKIHLSSLGSCFNSRSADFFWSLGVRRIILPRQLRLSEIKPLVREANPNLEFEVFALNDGCYFEEGFCQTSHALGPFCLTDWEVRTFDARGHELSAKERETHVDELREYLWYQNNCGSSFQKEGLPNGPCSLCWFGYFRDWGITAVKIAGREASFYRKMRSVQLVKAIMDEVRAGVPAEDIGLIARSLRKTPEYCEKGYMCYFRDS
ncbi:MAG: U32 family peptidase [Pseudomonadota bacterium]